MNTRKTYKSLATIAVGSLLVTGLGTGASANTLANQASSLQLLTGSTGAVSTKNDGANTTVKLHAIAPASVTSVKFSYRNGLADPVEIGTVTRGSDEGSFALEWNPGALVGSTVQLIAEGNDGSTSTQDLVLISGNTDTVDVASIASVGVFDQPYGPAGSSSYGTVRGTSSVEGDVEVRSLSTPAANPQPAATTVQSVNKDGKAQWEASVDFTGYTNDADNEFLVEASFPGALVQTTDTEAFDSYRQVITTVTATTPTTELPQGTATAPVTVKVVDQSGAPIRGARVSDGTDSKFTDIKGEAVFDQAPGTSKTYYADTTAQEGQQAGDVAASPVTIGSYVAQADSFKLNSADGAAFDLDEYASGDLKVVALDQKGNKITLAQDLTYYWIVTGANGVETRYPTAPATFTASPAGGEYMVELPSGGSGSYALYGSFETGDTIANSKIATVNAGQASFVFDENGPEQAPIGGTEEVTGSLELEDGTALPARDLTGSYLATGNSGLRVAGQTSLQTSTSVKTDAQGNFKFTVEDPASPNTAESGVLTVSGGAAFTDVQRTVEFKESLAPARIQFLDTVTDEAPGTVQTVRVRVEYNETPNGPTPTYMPLTNSEVELALTRGYFTDGKAVNPVAGQPAGTFTDLGQTETFTTDGSGIATVKFAIGRDADFDDDASATSKLTATAGTVTQSADATFSTDFDLAPPVNGGSVSIEFSEDERNQDSTALPQAELSQEVLFDLRATDSFGNPLLDVPVKITNNSAFGSNAPQDAKTDLDSLGDFTVSSNDREETITYKVAWDAPTTTYTNAQGATTSGTKTLEDSIDVEWYEVTAETSTYEVRQDGPANPKPGDIVQYVFTVTDKAGQPVPNAEVLVFQGSEQSTILANQNGVATYSLTRENEGTERIGAVVRVNDAQVGETYNDTVEFSNSNDGELLPPRVRIAGFDRKGGNIDLIRVNAQGEASGAKATLYFKKDGRWVKLSTKRLNERGNTQFFAKDRNKNRATLYKVEVEPTALTRAGQVKARIR